MFTSFWTTSSRFQFQVCLFLSHKGNSLVLNHPSEEKRKVAAVAQRVPNSTSAGRYGVTRSSRILDFFPFPPFNTKSFHPSPIIGTFPSTSQSSFRRWQSHKLKWKGPRQKFRSLSMCSIILPGNGSCWTWSGKAQTTCDVDRPRQENSRRTMPSETFKSTQNSDFKMHI